MDAVLKPVAVARDAPTSLLYLALYEWHTTSCIDVLEATWTSLLGPNTMGADESATECFDPLAMECEIHVLERRIVELRGARAPPFTLTAVQLMGTAPLPWVWQHDMLAALILYGKTDAAEARKAGHTQSVREVLYRCAEVL